MFTDTEEGIMMPIIFSTIEYKYTTYGKLVTIDDFISVNGLNTMKKIFENKILTEGTDTTKLFTCKKIAPKDGIIQGLFFNLSTKPCKIIIYKIAQKVKCFP